MFRAIFVKKKLKKNLKKFNKNHNFFCWLWNLLLSLSLCFAVKNINLPSSITESTKKNEIKKNVHSV